MTIFQKLYDEELNGRHRIFRRKVEMRKKFIVYLILLAALGGFFYVWIENANAGTWLGTDKMYKIAYGEYGLTAHSGYSTTYDNLYDRVWQYSHKLVTEYANINTAVSTIGATECILLIPNNQPLNASL